MTAKNKTPLERIQEHAKATLMGKSDLIAVDVTITGRVVTAEGTIEMVDLGSFNAAPREFSSGNKGFYLFGKVQDPTQSGQVNQVEFQVGCNITACKSKEWVAPE